MMERNLVLRVPQDLYDLLRRVTKDRGENESVFVRRAVLKELASLNYLPARQMKALGVTTTAEAPPQ